MFSLTDKKTLQRAILGYLWHDHTQSKVLNLTNKIVKGLKRRLDRKYLGGFIKRNGTAKFTCDCKA